uniref:Uncharacterized protein n=1 Tax=Plectus sambesii TaxID=2011161 RepID=A0A914URZ3_9BILA
MAKKRAAVRVIDLQDTLDNLHIRKDRTYNRNGNTVIIREVPIIVVVPVSSYEEQMEGNVRTSRGSASSPVDNAAEFSEQFARPSRSRSREETQSTKSLSLSSPTPSRSGRVEEQIGRSRSSDDFRRPVHPSRVVASQNAAGRWQPKRHGWQRWTNGPRGPPPRYLDNDL